MVKSEDFTGHHQWSLRRSMVEQTSTCPSAPAVPEGLLAFIFWKYLDGHSQSSPELQVFCLIMAFEYVWNSQRSFAAAITGDICIGGRCFNAQLAQKPWNSPQPYRKTTPNRSHNDPECNYLKQNWNRFWVVSAVTQNRPLMSQVTPNFNFLITIRI